MRFLALNLFYVLVVLVQTRLIGNHLSDTHYSMENSTDHTTKLSVSCSNNTSTVPASTEASHHECPVCHGHALALFTSSANTFDVAASSREQLKYFYQNPYYSISSSSIFRPPIA